MGELLAGSGLPTGPFAARRRSFTTISRTVAHGAEKEAASRITGKKAGTAGREEDHWQKTQERLSFLIRVTVGAFVVVIIVVTGFGFIFIFVVVSIVVATLTSSDIGVLPSHTGPISWRRISRQRNADPRFIPSSCSNCREGQVPSVRFRHQALCSPGIALCFTHPRREGRYPRGILRGHEFCAMRGRCMLEGVLVDATIGAPPLQMPDPSSWQ